MAIDVVVQREESFLANYGYPDPNDQFLILVAITVVIWVLESLFEYWWGILWRNLAQTAQHELRIDTYNHILKTIAFPSSVCGYKYQFLIRVALFVQDCAIKFPTNTQIEILKPKLLLLLLPKLRTGR
jgi:hypothetical protein